MTDIRDYTSEELIQCFVLSSPPYTVTNVCGGWQRISPKVLVYACSLSFSYSLLYKHIGSFGDCTHAAFSLTVLLRYVRDRNLMSYVVFLNYRKRMSDDRHIRRLRQYGEYRACSPVFLPH